MMKSILHRSNRDLHHSEKRSSFRSRLSILLLSIAFIASSTLQAKACTGISLKATDGSYTIARTIEWGGSKLTNQYVIVPRRHSFQSYTPTGKNGLSFISKYGFAGVSIMDSNFIVDGINEAGLAAGLFYFPGYGSYGEYNSDNNNTTIADMQLVSWILSQFSTVKQVRQTLPSLSLVSIAGSSTVHWRVADASGAQIVIEYINGECTIYDNKVGVLSNSPSFDWQVTNLNNYVNLYYGAAAPREYDNDVILKPFGAGSGMLGLPGDMTPPSRFVRAFFLKSSAPAVESGYDAVLQSFQLLNSFDVPMGLLYEGQNEPGIPSSTQWTAAADITNCKYYYRTMYNSAIRCIDLQAIDFAKVEYFTRLLDRSETTPIEMVPTQM